MARPRGVEEFQPRKPGGGRKTDFEKLYYEPDESNRLKGPQVQVIINLAMSAKDIKKRLCGFANKARGRGRETMERDALFTEYVMALVEMVPQMSLLTVVDTVDHVAFQAVGRTIHATTGRDEPFAMEFMDDRYADDKDYSRADDDREAEDGTDVTLSETGADTREGELEPEL